MTNLTDFRKMVETYVDSRLSNACCTKNPN